MSIRAMNWAWGLEDLTPAQTLVLLSLADQANDGGYCWPSQDLIAARSRMTVRNVRRIVADLRRFGLIETSVRAGQSGRKSLVYWLNVGADFSLGNNQRDKLSSSETLVDNSEVPSVPEPAENSTFPREITNGTNCPVADDEVSQEDTSVRLQEDTGVRLVPIVQTTNGTPNPIHSISRGEDSRESGSVDVDVDWDLIRQSIPESCRVFDGRAAARIADRLHELVAGGWTPSQIKSVLSSHQMPDAVTNMAGLVIRRLADIPVEGAPVRATVVGDHVNLAEPPGEEPQVSLEDLPVAERPAWFIAQQEEIAKGGPNADKPTAWWATSWWRSKSAGTPSEAGLATGSEQSGGGVS